MNNLSPMISFSILVLLFAVGAFALVRFGGTSLQPEPVSIFAPEQRTDSFFRQEGSRIEESAQYTSAIQESVQAQLQSGERLERTTVLYPHALQVIRGEASTSIAIVRYSSQTTRWEIIETTDRQIDAVYLNSLGVPINDARQLMRLFRIEE